MSKRATDAALKALPDYSPDGKHEADLTLDRLLYQHAYEQAEKDLALTWEDASAIVEIAMDIIGEGKIHGEQNIYTEVLKRFNEQKKK